MDCEFIVGLPPNFKIFHVHKMFLAMSSPVFEAMFYGGLAETKREIKISDVQPDAFSCMLEYIYTDEVNLASFELVCDICYAAKKYMLPELVEECTKFLWRDLYPRNACRIYEFAKLFEEPILLEKSLQIITNQTIEIINEPSWEDVEQSTLQIFLSRDTLSAPEVLLFDAIDRWSTKECERRGVEVSPEKKRFVLGEALFLIRYLTLTAAEFAAGPARSGLLTQQESFAILMNISCPGSWDLPKHMNSITEVRKGPSVQAASDLDLGTKLWCKRAMMQEPHCLNTSILDCSVTFTVDRDVWIHGIEVPSQVTDIPEGVPLEGVELLQGEGYNELLYSHLLDGEGTRLTYTHFTAKVNWNSMIEICFNRSVKIQANRVYRIGMVLNKVGWYPMGVCTRRVNCDGSFFTFCVGQPNDTQRDGLIRSIIFSR
ncbi:BTB/POZ domain-containing protein 6 isoform X2 [Eurytemora carolleeae]|uniref:BTB/POZ domain-containing protein 6 isoform X2 n=1 Tax=Eurytemora carolleeae TaxID=1294199 RepID=UPI000C76D882|nr:BTB/POZ domain-containing protein 6 isoform X2 [Eurytemora carolleeae]|eukprot:XP_023320442.1 BTB/POZ domain-containing protein 6-like isoform X2 [Eurytemora affinis]